MGRRNLILELAKLGQVVDVLPSTSLDHLAEHLAGPRDRAIRRRLHEFENENYVEGDVFMLNATLKF